MPRGVYVRSEKLTRREIAQRYRDLHPEKSRTASDAWRAGNPDYAWIYALTTKYGITPDEYLALLRSQDFACALCRRPAAEFSRRLHVDHDHQSLQVRGLLCFDCNSGIGKFADDPARLRAAAGYLERKAS